MGVGVAGGVQGEAEVRSQGHLGGRHDQPAVGKVMHRPQQPRPDQAAHEVAIAPLGGEIHRRRRPVLAAQEFAQINAANLIKAHAQIESGTTIGKVVLSGW